MKRKQLKAALLIFFVTMPLLSICAEEEATTTKEAQLIVATEKRIRLNASFNYATFDFLGVKISGPGFNMGLSFGINPKLAASLSFGQGFSSFSFASGYSSINFGLTYALFGKTILQTTETSVGRDKVITSRERNTGGLYLSLYAHQYFINTVAAAIPFPGMGAALEYEFRLNDMTNLGVGGRYDQCVSSATTFNPMQFFLGLKFWL